MIPPRHSPDDEALSLNKKRKAFQSNKRDAIFLEQAAWPARRKPRERAR